MAHYTWFGKPRGDGRGGVGFWVHDSILTRISITTPKVQHNSILWIKFVGDKSLLHMSIVYSAPNKPAAHIKLMKALDANVEQLGQTGAICGMGDFNTKLIHITEGIKTTYSKDSYEHITWSFIKKHRLHVPASSRDVIERKEHFTYNCDLGQSTPDYFMTCSRIRSSNYMVHQGLNLGSDHRLMTLDLEVDININQWAWGTNTHARIVWENDIPASYAKEVARANDRHKHMTALPTTKANMLKLLDYITGVLNTALDKVKTPPKKNRGKGEPHAQAISRTVSSLIQGKTAILKTLTCTSKTARKLKWKQIHDLQTQIQSQAHRKKDERNIRWWMLIKSYGERTDSRAFYKEVKKLKLISKPAFPHMLQGSNGVIHTSPAEIMKEIVNEFVSISTNSDKEALEFNTQHNITRQEQETIGNKTKREFEINRTRNNATKNTGIELCDKPPERKEIGFGVKKAETNKSTGKDNMPSEALKHMGEDMLALITLLFSMMWELSITPTLLSHAITILIHKKGPTDNIKNYRPITLLNTLHKIWERILEQRLRTLTTVSEEQMGSQPGNSATIATMTKRSLLRLAKRLHIDIHSLQLDLSKAYNRVCRKTLWNKLAKLGVKGKLWAAIISTYEQAQDQIKIGSTLSSPFHLDFGLRQGSILSPILFIIYVDELIQNIEGTGTGARGSETEADLELACIMFVDDIETYTHTAEGLKAQFEAAIVFARTNHAVINMTKSTMTSSKGSSALRAIKKRTHILLEVLKTTKQLGTSIRAKDITHPDPLQASNDVTVRSGITSSMITTMTRRGMNTGEMALTDMTEVISTIVLPTLTFGLARTDLTKKDRKRLRTTMAQATQAALGINSTHDPTEMWATLEMGINDPVDDITINDWTTLITMTKNEANPLAASIVTTDTDLQAKMISVRDKWNFNASALAARKKKERHSWLGKKARAYRIQQVKDTYFDPEGIPVWSSSSLGPTHIALLVQYRSMKAQGRMADIKHCTLCHQTNIDHDTIQHYLSHCARGAEIAFCPNKRSALTKQEAITWAYLDGNEISKLCAHPHKRENLLILALETLNHCLLFDPERTTILL